MKYMLRKLALASCIGMFLVLLMGTLVTKTESGRGCGDDWPLCNGKFIPAYTVESMIEYSHRFVTGIEGLLVLGATVGVYLYIKRKDARFYAASSLFLRSFRPPWELWPSSGPNPLPCWRSISASRYWHSPAPSCS
ncbi:COX15/CtaA family protein [Paenibacillus sp. CC-CFT747]|nr:COX15/CtaA family protein [Paenibacillus sp. CC-CFT747]